MHIAAFFSYAYSETLRFDVNRDVWISAYPGEENYNMGATRRLKLKGIQEMAILDFDLSPLKGKKIESARLYLCDTGRKNKLRKIGISTVASPWIEGNSRGYFVDLFGHGATFYYSSYKKQKWAGRGSDLTDVTMGNGNTWQQHTELRREKGMWWSVDITPDLIHVLITGKSHGLLIMDESGQTFANNYVFSRESKHSSPYIMITFSKAQKKKPQKLNLELSPSLENAHMESGAIAMKIPIKEDIFAFDVYINDEAVPLWRVPRPGQINSTQEIIIDWLRPEEKVNIKIMAVNELGQRSEPTVITGYSSKSLPKIALSEEYENKGYPPVSPLTKGGIKESVLSKEGASLPQKTFRIWAVPDVTKIDPVSGRVLSEINTNKFDKKNPIWFEDIKEITLSGIKGEIIAFQLCVETGNQTFGDIEFKLTPLISDTGSKISDDRFSLYQVHYLKVKEKWYPELAIPMRDRKIVIKTNRRHIENQKNQLIYVDLAVPPEIDAGSYHGDIVISGNGIKEESLNINLKLADILMPKKLIFVPELNMYKGPGKAGTERFFNAHRLAHEHRVVINRVPYSQKGKAHEDMIPKILYLSNGQISIDWTDYDRRLGALFNGTAFTRGERKGIPVEKFYLPFFENWPTALAPNYQYGEFNYQRNIKKSKDNPPSPPFSKGGMGGLSGEYAGIKTQEIISKHALEATSLDKALSSVYKERFIEIVREFKNHFEEKGWNQTEFQFYLNNKWKWKGSSSWWNLDEPMSYDDWMALRFFGSLFHQAKGLNPIQFVFRADISRPRWQHDWLNGILERMYVKNKAIYSYPDRIRKLKKEGRINFSVYGSLNDIKSSNHQTVLWCMKAFVEGADGVLPWQSLGGSEAFNVPNKNALIVDARETLGIDWVVSFRVKALRRCQQNVELLAMLEKKNGYKRKQIRDFFYRYFGINNSGDERPYIKKRVNTDKMEKFRKMLIEMLLINREKSLRVKSLRVKR